MSPRSPDEFCLELRAARKRRGLTLERIAEVTKVCPSHFRALERGDLRLWPKGIFRRAFFRGYVQMIGLPVAETLEEFVRLFPDDEGGKRSTGPGGTDSPLRLGLDSSWHGPTIPLRSRVTTAAGDIGVVLATAGLAWVAGANLAIATAITAVTYFAIARILVDDSPAAWAATTWHRLRAAAPDETTPLRMIEEAEPVVRSPWRRAFDVVVTETGDQEVETDYEAQSKRLWTRRAG